jgi:hypothetical protein
MLQIISGKFFESDDRYSYDCRGILYSNISWSNTIETCVAKLEPADVYGKTSAYVMSYNNQMEKEEENDKEVKGFRLVKTGDTEILKQFKYLCTFGLKAIFDGDRDVVYRMCRTAPISSNEHNLPSGYINQFLDTKFNTTQKEINEFINFVEDVIGLPRKVYNIAISCLGAFEAAIKLLDDDINLAYSMMIYCAETLSQNFDNYTPIWDDYNQNQRLALEKCFVDDIKADKVEKIKEILLNNEHLKLTRRFVNFIVKNLDDDFYISDAYSIGRAVNKNEIERALINAYNMRSRYVHSLQPIMKQLIDTKIVKSNDIFEFQNDSFFTFGGLTRTIHRAIWNFIKSYPKVAAEKIYWRNELPGIISLELAPQYWVWKADGFISKHITKKLEGFFEIIIAEKKVIPDMRPILEKCRELFSSATKEQQNEIFCLYKLYNTFIREEFRSEGYKQFIEDNNNLLCLCSIVNMAMLTLPIPIEVDICWDFDICDEVIKKYNRKKYDGKHIRLPNIIETMIYINMANSYKDEDADKQKEWLNHALFNSSGSKGLQDIIQKSIDSLDMLDVTSIFDNFYKSITEDK